MPNLDAKCFKNKWCQECIATYFLKYPDQKEFGINCKGITVEDDVKNAIKNGIDEDTARYILDGAYFFEKTYGKKMRPYQFGPTYCTAKNSVLRFARQTGKTLTIVMKLLHHVVTNEKVTVLICTPNEKQVRKIFDEYLLRDGINRSEELKSSVRSKGQKPFYYIEFDNDSKILLSIASVGIEGQTADVIYMDEAGKIPRNVMSSIIMTTGAQGSDAIVIETSTPKTRGDLFFEACKLSPSFAEFHTSMLDVPEMKDSYTRFSKLIGPTATITDLLAEFPESGSDCPFNYKGIDLAKKDYQYEDCQRQDGLIYILGCDSNGPTIGTYFHVISFDPSTYQIVVVDKKIVASVEWNSLAAKQALIDLNRKWNCAHLMYDYGYSSAICEELRAYSIQVSQSLGPNHPDSRIKSILDTVEFGSFITLTDPFTKEEMKKTTKAFIVSQVARLFEPRNDQVAISFPKADNDLVRSLESYKLLQMSARGYEQYGFAPGDGIEDHQIDALNLAIYGVVKYYSELFKRIIYQSVSLGANEAFINQVIKPPIIDARGRDILLISSNDDTPIHLEETKIKDPFEQAENIISRTFGKSGVIQRSGSFSFNSMRNRSGVVQRTRM